MNVLIRSVFSVAVASTLVSVLPSVLASDQDAGDIAAVRACLRNFEKHPFNAEKPTFRTMGAKVRVFGIGESTQDEKSSEKPELVLVKPNVAVLSKTELNLLNPNGWYCLKGQVAVLGKSEVYLHCKAKLASSRDGVTILGANDHDGGVTVLGASRVVRVGCTSESRTVSAPRAVEEVKVANESAPTKAEPAPKAALETAPAGGAATD